MLSHITRTNAEIENLKVNVAYETCPQCEVLTSEPILGKKKGLTREGTIREESIELNRGKGQ